MIEVILLTRLMVTRLSTNSVMVRDRVAQLPSYLVRQWRLATKHKTDSLWLRRGRTQSGPVLLQEKSIQTNTSLSLLRFVAISNTKVKIPLPKLS